MHGKNIDITFAHANDSTTGIKGLGKMANHKQEPWKMPLLEYIERLHQKRYGEIITGITKPLEVVDAEKRARKAEKKKEDKLSEINT